MKRKGPGKRRRKAARPKPHGRRPAVEADSPHRFGHFTVLPSRVQDWGVRYSEPRDRSDDDGPGRPWPEMR